MEGELCSDVQAVGKYRKYGPDFPTSILHWGKQTTKPKHRRRKPRDILNQLSAKHTAGDLSESQFKGSTPQTQRWGICFQMIQNWGKRPDWMEAPKAISNAGSSALAVVSAGSPGWHGAALGLRLVSRRQVPASVPGAAVTVTLPTPTGSCCQSSLPTTGLRSQETSEVYKIPYSSCVWGRRGPTGGSATLGALAHVLGGSALFPTCVPSRRRVRPLWQRHRAAVPHHFHQLAKHDIGH